ncbi:MAG: penicillin-binding transpeptidase domain-containing protein, partial [Kurthia gibsonii]
QTLTLYNAVANNGIMVKPKFVQEVKEWNKIVKTFDTEVINPRICSDGTLKKVRAMLQNVVKRGTASKLYSKDFSMAGKTGTAQINYHKGDTHMYYASSFAGYFPADNPAYSCIVVIHKPNTSNNNYYGADVAGPVFKRIAQKVFTDVPSTDVIKTLQRKVKNQEKSYITYNDKLNKKPTVIPNLKGMPGMDAVALLENLGMKVKAVGFGKVKKQSIQAGQPIRKNNIIVLELS